MNFNETICGILSEFIFILSDNKYITTFTSFAIYFPFIKYFGGSNVNLETILLILDKIIISTFTVIKTFIRNFYSLN